MPTYDERAVILTDVDGNSVVVTGAGAVKTDGSAATQPVSAISLPLPTGAATSALQTQPGVDIGDVTVNNAAGAGAVNVQDGGNSLTVDGPLTDAELRATAVPISAASLPLPTGAATSALQTTGNSSLSSIDGKTPALVSGRVPVDGSGVTQPVSAVSLPLPTGAATAALQTQPGVDIGDVTVNNAAGASAVNIQDGGNSITVDGTVSTQFDKPTTASLSSVVINAAANGNNTLIAGVGGQTIRVFKLFLVCAANVDVIFRDGGATDLTGVMSLSKYGSMTLDLDGEPWFVTSAGNAFVLNLSGAFQVSGRIYYTQS